MTSWFYHTRKANPLLLLTLIAILPRFIAAIFAPGYFAHDDHFLIIEAAQSWVDGFDYNSWLPWNQQGEPKATGHSYFYVGIHYLLFSLLDFLGLQNPEWNLLLVRLLHALWSLIVVRCAYRLSFSLYRDTSIAFNTGLFLALFYFMPYLSVRTMPEMACIPFLMLGVSRLVSERKARDLLLAGLFLGLAANVRFQTLAFAAGTGLILLFIVPFRKSMVFAIGSFLPLILIQGGLDLAIWGEPFVEIREYVAYNLENRNNYITHPWYQYLMLIPAILIPPFSLFLLRAIAPVQRKLLPVLGGLLLFILIHSMIGNKQERFILPIMTVMMTITYSGLLSMRPRLNGFWKKAEIVSRRIAWSISTVVMVLLCFSYGKRSRVEIMKDLRQEAHLVKNLVIENSVHGNYVLLPQYHADAWQRQ